MKKIWTFLLGFILTSLSHHAVLGRPKSAYQRIIEAYQKKSDIIWEFDNLMNNGVKPNGSDPCNEMKYEIEELKKINYTEIISSVTRGNYLLKLIVGVKVEIPALLKCEVVSNGKIVYEYWYIILRLRVNWQYFRLFKDTSIENTNTFILEKDRKYSEIIELYKNLEDMRTWYQSVKSEAEKICEKHIFGDIIGIQKAEITIDNFILVMEEGEKVQTVVPGVLECQVLKRYVFMSESLDTSYYVVSKPNTGLWMQVHKTSKYPNNLYLSEYNMPCDNVTM